jgi:hypothetical protein
MDEVERDAIDVMFIRRPSIEFYRRQDEIDLLLPVAASNVRPAH